MAASGDILQDLLKWVPRHSFRVCSAVAARIREYLTALSRSAIAAQRYEDLRRMDPAERARRCIPADLPRQIFEEFYSGRTDGRPTAIAADGEEAHCEGRLLHPYARDMIRP